MMFSKRKGFTVSNDADPRSFHVIVPQHTDFARKAQSLGGHWRSGAWHFWKASRPEVFAMIDSLFGTDYAVQWRKHAAKKKKKPKPLSVEQTLAAIEAEPNV